jgi:UDP-glucuronate 4-epimerase
MSVLITGVAGFLGMHVAEALLARGEQVAGIDEPGPGHDPALGEARLHRLTWDGRFTFAHGDVADAAFLADWAKRQGDDITGVVHLADAREPEPLRSAEAAGRRLGGHLALLDLCCERLPGLRHLVHVLPCPGSTPAGNGLPLGKAEATLGRAYARLHGIPQTALRFAGLYGPWDRADSLCHVLADAILAGRPVTLPEAGGRVRLTWVEDAVAGILAALDRPPAADGAGPHRLLDLPGPEPVELERLLGVLEEAMGRQVERRRGTAVVGLPEDDGVDGEPARDLLGWAPRIGIEEGIGRFVAWHRARHGSA